MLSNPARDKSIMVAMPSVWRWLRRLVRCKLGMQGWGVGLGSAWGAKLWNLRN